MHQILFISVSFLLYFLHFITCFCCKYDGLPASSTWKNNELTFEMFYLLGGFTFLGGSASNLVESWQIFVTMHYCYKPSIWLRFLEKFPEKKQTPSAVHSWFSFTNGNWDCIYQNCITLDKLKILTLIYQRIGLVTITTAGVRCTIKWQSKSRSFK